MNSYCIRNRKQKKQLSTFLNGNIISRVCQFHLGSFPSSICINGLEKKNYNVYRLEDDTKS